MKKEREFDVSVSYPLINQEDAHVIQSYYQNTVSKIESDGTYSNHIYALQAFCAEINQEGVPPFKQWNYSTADAYLSQIKCGYAKAALIVKIAKAILYAAGCKESLIGLKGSHYGNKYHDKFYTFDEMQTMIKRAYDSTHKEICWDTLNDWSTSIVICYLLWLGFSQKEIAILKKTDYNPKFNVVALESGDSIKRRTVDEPEIGEYLQKYIQGHKFYLYNEYHGKRPYDYAYSDFLIKSVKREGITTADVVNACCRKFSQHFGFVSDDVLLAGRMNRLYYYNIVKGIEISNQNVAIVAEYLDLEKPAKVVRNGELGNLISMYPSYKEQLLEHFNNKS